MFAKCVANPKATMPQIQMTIVLTTTHPKRGVSKEDTTKMCGDRNSRYGGNRNRRLGSNHDNEIKMTKNAKRIISQADRGLALTKYAKKIKFTRIL